MMFLTHKQIHMIYNLPLCLPHFLSKISYETYFKGLLKKIIQISTYFKIQTGVSKNLIGYFFINFN